MALKVKDIAGLMDRLAPVELAEKWDNCGLLVGDPAYNVHRVLVSLDATMDVVEEAILKDVQMIITHHPILFEKTGRITADTTEGNKVIRLIQNNIALYAAHTNLDQATGGLEDTLAKRIGLIKPQILDPRNITENGDPLGYGRAAHLAQATTLSALASHVTTVLSLPGLQIVGDPETIIRVVATACGSGSSQIDAAKKAGADVLITGDVKYHTAQYALDSKICLIDAGHFGTEQPVVALIAGYLRENAPELLVLEDGVFQNPIKFMK